MVTTIEISEEVKKRLDSLRKNNGTYDDILRELLREYKRNIISEQMADYGKKYSNECLEEVKEWENTDLKWR